MLSDKHAEELIREALAAQAVRAPSSVDVLAELNDTTKRRTSWFRVHIYRSDQLVVVAAVGALVVLAAVAIPLGLSGFHQTEQGTGGIGKGVTFAQLGYRPKWVPAGYVPVTQSVALTSDDGGSYAAWWPAADVAKVNTGTFPSRMIWMATWQIPRNAAKQGLAGKHEKVDINGFAGDYSTEQTGKNFEAEVDFSPVWNLRVAVQVANVPDARNVVLRMARSIVKDPSSTIDIPVSVDNSVNDVAVPEPAGVGPVGAYCGTVLNGTNPPSFKIIEPDNVPTGTPSYIPPPMGSGSPSIGRPIGMVSTTVLPGRVAPCPPAVSQSSQPVPTSGGQQQSGQPTASVTGVPYPQSSVDGSLFVSGSSPHDWTVLLERPLGTNGFATLNVGWGPGIKPIRDPSTVGTPVTVFGQRGWYLNPAQRLKVFGVSTDATTAIAQVVVKVNGWWLTVGGVGVDQATAVALANSVTVYPEAKFDWLGV